MVQQDVEVIRGNMDDVVNDVTSVREGVTAVREDVNIVRYDIDGIGRDIKLVCFVLSFRKLFIEQISQVQAQLDG